MTDNAKPATAPAPAQAAETQTSTEGTNVTLASAPSSSSLPMFIASSDVGQVSLLQFFEIIVCLTGLRHSCLEARPRSTRYNLSILQKAFFVV